MPRLLMAAMVLVTVFVGPSSSKEPEVAALLAQIQDRDWQLRREAALQLGTVASPDDEVVSALRTALSDIDSRVRRSSAMALGQIGAAAARATPQLIERLRDRDPGVVRSAAGALGSIGRKASRARKPLKQLLEDPDPRMRLAGADALARMNRATSASSAALTALLGSPDGETRAAAARALGQPGDDAAASSFALTQRLGDDDPQVRSAAIEALGRQGGAAVPALIASLSSVNPVLLQGAVEALANVGEPAIPALIGTLDSKQKSLLARQYAARALARIGNRTGQALPALLDRLKDESPLIRIAAIEGLGNLGPAAGPATPHLIEVIDNRDEDLLVREYAITAIASVAPTSPEVRTRLIEAVADSNPRISEAAVAALVRIRSLTERPEAVSRSIAELRDGDPGRRLAAARELAELGPCAGGAVATLTDTLRSEGNSPELRAAAVRTLGMIGPAAEPSLPALNDALRSTNTQLNQAALIAMQRIGPKTRTLPALMEALKDSDLGVRGSAAVSIRNFALARLEGWQALLAQSDAPVLRAWVAQHKDLYGVDAKAPQRLGKRHTEASADYFDVLGGRAAVRESIQLKSMEPVPGRAGAAKTLPIEEIRHIDIRPHPFEKMLNDSGRPPGKLPLADFAPSDRLFAYFRNPAALRDFLADSGGLFLRLESAFALKSFDYDLASRYLARMGLTRPVLSQLGDTDAIGEIALVVPDLFFIDGTDITAVLRLRSPSHSVALLHLAGIGETGASTLQLTKLPSGESVYWTRRDDLLFVSTSSGELKSVVDSRDNPKKDSLGRSAEFRYMLQQLPFAETTQAYFYASDPFLRKLIGPETKIAQLRRTLARADLDRLTAGAMLYKLDGNTAAATKSRLIELGYVPQRLADRDYAIGDDLVAASVKFGTSAALKPLSANPVTLVSEAEATAYGNYLEDYTKYWRQFFDPIAIRLDKLDENRSELTTFILPLLDSELYDQVRKTLTSAGSGLRLKVPQLTPAPVLLVSMNLSDSMRLSLAEDLADVIRRFTTVDPAIFDAFTPTVHFAVQDSTPILAVGSGDVLGAFSENLLQLEGFESFLPILLSLVSQPSSLYIELADPEAVLKFLREATSGRRAGGEGEFHQIAGEDAWIYTVSLFDMMQLHLRVAVEDKYLVISNLPWSSRASLTGSTEEPLNGARIELNLEAMSEQLPALHTRSYSDYRIAAVDGMGYLYPLLATGAVHGVGDALDRHFALFGFKPVHPGSGEWLWKDGEISSSIFGTPQSPRQPPYAPGERDFGLFPALRSVRVNAQLEDRGLRTSIRWQRVAH